MKLLFQPMVFHSKNLLKNRGVISLLFVFFIILSFLGAMIWGITAKELEEEVVLVTPVPEVPKDIKIIFVGDIMFDRGVRASIIKNFGGNYNKLFEHTLYLKDADISFGNLEGPVANTGARSGSRFSFRMDPAGLSAMRDIGFDVVSFANNHVGDYTLVAFKETLSRLIENNILYSGAGKDYKEATTPAVINVRGLDVGFLAMSDVGPEWMKATDNRAGILLANDPNILDIIAIAKMSVDVLVVSFHFGDEYSPVNSRQEKLAHMAIDAGADIVVGHHPHVMQRFEVYKDKPIFYSLGNFIFDQYFSPQTLQGMVATVLINPETKDTTSQLQVSPISTQYIPQPLIPFDELMLVKKTFIP